MEPSRLQSTFQILRGNTLQIHPSSKKLFLKEEKRKWTDLVQHQSMPYKLDLLLYLAAMNSLISEKPITTKHVKGSLYVLKIKRNIDLECKKEVR